MIFCTLNSSFSECSSQVLHNIHYIMNLCYTEIDPSHFFFPVHEFILHYKIYSV